MSSASPRPDSKAVVILIEDDNRLAAALEMLIEDWGYDCIAERTPKAAAERLGLRHTDVIAIIADLSRADAYTGLRSAEAIANTLGSDVPCIATTNEPLEAESHGFAAVLSKPYDPEELKAWLRDQANSRTRSA